MSTHMPAVDLADDVAGLDRVLLALDPALVHDGQVGAELVGVALGHLHPAGVGRHDDEVVAAVGAPCSRPAPAWR